MLFLLYTGLRLCGWAWDKIYWMVGPAKMAIQCNIFFDDYQDSPNRSYTSSIRTHHQGWVCTMHHMLSVCVAITILLCVIFLLFLIVLKIIKKLILQPCICSEAVYCIYMLYLAIKLVNWSVKQIGRHVV